MVSWDDLAVELNKASDEFEKVIKAFESLTKTYQDLIDYCKKWGSTEKIKAVEGVEDRE